VNQFRRFRDRLNHACFIIDRLQGQHRPEPSHTGQLFAQIVEVEPALRVERDLRDLVGLKPCPAKTQGCSPARSAGTGPRTIASHVRGLGGAGDENHPVGLVPSVAPARRAPIRSTPGRRGLPHGRWKRCPPPELAETPAALQVAAAT